MVILQMLQTSVRNIRVYESYKNIKIQMEKMINDMISAYQSMQPKRALDIANQILTKQNKPTKKKIIKLDDQNFQKVILIKISSHLNLGQLHTANHQIKKYFDTPQKIKSLLLNKSTVLINILYSSLDQKTQNMVSPFLNEFKSDENLHPLFLFNGLLNELSLVYFQTYAKTKNLSFLVSHLQLFYLKLIQPHCYETQPTYSLLQGASTQMIKSFFEKCYNEISSQLLNAQNKETRTARIDSLLEAKKTLVGKDPSSLQKINQIEKQLKIINDDKENINKLLSIKNQLNHLKAKIFLHQREYKKIEPLLQQIEDPFHYLRIVKESVFDIYLSHIEKIFKKNLNFQTYTPLYQYYDQFLQSLLARGYKLESVENNINLPLNQLYTFKTNSNLLQTYFNSLLSQYQIVKKSQIKSDYYSICLKGLLLQIIKILHSFSLPKEQFLKQYIDQFARTLSFANEMQQYWQFLIPLIKQFEINSIDSMIADINFTKILINSQKSVLNSQHIIRQFVNYRKLRSEIQHNRHLKKGQRYISDEYLIIAADIVRMLINQATDQKSIYQYKKLIITELDEAIKQSPYNSDLKLRQMHFSASLNHYEKVFAIFQTLDIKNAQWETLSYWVITPIINYDLNHSEVFQKMLKAFQQNNRETAIYGNKALKACDLRCLQQFLAYRTYISNSYSKLMLFFAVYLNVRFQHNSTFYLLQIRDIILNNNISFSCDYKTIQNVCFKQNKFGQFYGVYNNSKILLHQIYLRLNEEAIIASLTNKPCEFKIQSIQSLNKHKDVIQNIEEIYDFKQYKSASKTLDSVKSPFQTKIILAFYKKTIALKFLCLSIALWFDQDKPQNIRKCAEQFIMTLKNAFSEYQSMSWRLKSRNVFIFRRCLFECWAMVQLLAKHFNANNVLKQCSEECLNALRNSSCEDSVKENDQIDSKQDQSLRRAMEITKSQINARKIKYQSAYR